MNTQNRKPVLSLTKKDFEIQTFRSGGKGGQRQNKVETGVRIVHVPSGASGEARDSAHQSQNRIAAFERLCERKEFITWLRLQTLKRQGQNVEPRETEAQIRTRVDEQFDRDMRDGLILVEEICADDF